MTSVMPSPAPPGVDMLISVNPASRSASPLTPSPSREMRGIKLFRAISRKLARRSNENLNTTDSRSSSSESSKKGDNENSSSRDSGFRSFSPSNEEERITGSSSCSDAGSDDVHPQRRGNARHHLSTSAESIRKVFQNLNLNARSQSCNNAKDVKSVSKRSSKSKSKKSTPTKRILRAPVTYTYVRGLSGLPTQRIPKNQVRAYTINPCGCSMQYMAALNR